MPRPRPATGSLRRLRTAAPPETFDGRQPRLLPGLPKQTVADRALLRLWAGSACQRTRCRRQRRLHHLLRQEPHQHRRLPRVRCRRPAQRPRRWTHRHWQGRVHPLLPAPQTRMWHLRARPPGRTESDRHQHRRLPHLLPGADDRLLGLRAARSRPPHHQGGTTLVLRLPSHRTHRPTPRRG